MEIVCKWIVYAHLLSLKVLFYKPSKCGVSLLLIYYSLHISIVQMCSVKHWSFEMLMKEQAWFNLVLGRTAKQPHS